MLRTVNYGESDRVVTLLGRSTGCLAAIARGARKSQKRFGGGLGLCSVGEAALRERAGAELLTLERFEVTTSYPALSADVLKMADAAYAAELVAKLCAPRQAEPAVFDWTCELLRLLDAQPRSAERLRAFELGLLDRLGFGPALLGCATCGRTDLSEGETIDVRWDPDRGGVVCRGCGARGRPMRPVVRLALVALMQQPLTAAPELTLPGDVARGARDALAELIATHLSAPLRSLEFLSKLEGGP